MQVGDRHSQQLWGIRPDEIQILKKADGSDWILGSGGFGSVYKAQMNGVNIVAVKVGCRQSSSAWPQVVPK